jgi:hypothetical protein
MSFKITRSNRNSMWALDLPMGNPFRGPAFGEYRDPVKDVLEFQSNAGQDARDLYRKDPERIFIGANTPFESAVWGTILGKDYEPTVDMFGGTTSYNSKTASERGINTGPGESMHQIARAITMFFAGGALGDAMGGGEAATAGTENGVETTGVLGSAETAPIDIPAGESTLAESQAGTSTQGSEFLNSSGGSSTPTGTVTNPTVDQSGAVLDASGSTSASMPPAVETMPAAVVDPAAAATPTTTAGGGLINSAMNFAKTNPLLTAAGLTIAGGAVQGAGNRANQKEIADRNIQASRDLQTQRQQQAIELEEWKRRFAQSGSYFDALVPFRRRPNAPLMRQSTGTPVYQNGLIASAMNNGG